MTHEPGRFINRDITAGEITEAGVDALIEKRHKQRVAEEGERPAEQMWAESVRRHSAARDERKRVALGEYHREHAERLRSSLSALIEHHEEQAEKYLPKGAT